MKPNAASKGKATIDLNSRGAVEKLMAPTGGSGVIDFWAPWCAPCRATAPHFEAVATLYAGQPMGFYKINTEAHPELGSAFNVRSIPTLMFVHNGEIADVVIGAVNAAQLTEKVEWLLSKARGEGFWDRLWGKRKTTTEPGPAKT